MTRRDEDALVAQLGQRGAGHDPGGHLGQLDAGGLGHERDGPGCPGVGLDHEDLVGLDRVLHVDEAPDVERVRDAAGVLLDDLDGLGRQVGRGQHAGAVARVHAGLLDVLHDPADEDLARRVADGVDVDLGGVLEEAVDEHRALGRQATFLAQAAEPGERGHGGAEAVVVVDDLHGPTAEHVGGPHQHRVADPLDDGERRLDGRGGAPGRLGDLELGAQGVPALAILGQVDGVGAGAEHQVAGQQPGQLQRGLPAEGDDDADRLLGLDDVHDVLVGERLEVEPVAGVVVGGHRLGVAVDHDRLEAGVVEGEAGVDAAVVELDALADAVGARAEDDDLRLVAGADLVLVLVGRVVVRRVGIELGRAGVDGLERGPDPGGETSGPDLELGDPGRRGAPEVRQLGVGEAEPLGPAPRGPRHVGHADGRPGGGAPR